MLKRNDTLISVKEDVLETEILQSLSKLDELHLASKKESFSRNLPFYTCLNKDNHWLKEVSSGEAWIVFRNWDFEKEKSTETILKKIR